VCFNEVLLAVVSTATFEPCPLDDVTDVVVLLIGVRDMTDDDFCFGGLFMGGVSSQLVPQLFSSRDTLVS